MSLARKTFDDFDNMDMNMGLGFGNVGMGNMGNMGHMGQMGMGGLGGMGMGTPSQTRSRMFDLLGGMRNDMVDQCVSSTIMPSMDVVETTDKVCYHFDLPGISDKEQINLSIDTNLLRINCEKPQICCVAHTADERLTLTYHRHERSWGKYERCVRIPASADMTKVCSCYKNGVLTVTIDKFPKEVTSSGGLRKLQIN